MEDALGHQKAVKPVLSASIPIPQALRSVTSTVQLFATTLASQTGKKIVILEQPYRERKVTWGANNERAIDALARLADEIGPVTIRLLFDPSDLTYYLSLTPLGQTPNVASYNNEAAKTPLTTSPFFVKDK